jgi:hypothetical protein
MVLIHSYQASNKGVGVAFSKEPGTRLKNRFVHFRTRSCLDISYLLFYNKPLRVPENGKPAWILALWNSKPTVDFASRT